MIKERHLTWFLDKIIELESDVKHYKHQLECMTNDANHYKHEWQNALGTIRVLDKDGTYKFMYDQ